MVATAILEGLTGVAIGALIGAVAQVTTFCSVGAIADIVLAGDWRRARSWILAGAVALAGTQAAVVAGLVPRDTLYTAPVIAVLPVGLGALAFGYGMAIAGGCLQRALVRIGGGSIKSLVTVAMMAVAAVLTVRVLATTGAWSTTATPIASPGSLDHIVAGTIGIAPGVSRFALTGLVTAALLAFCLKDSWFRSSPSQIWGGAAIGAAVVLAWLNWRATAVPLAGLNPFDDLINSARWVVHPLAARDALYRFGAGILLGIVFGAFLIAAIRGDLMFDRFADRDDVKRHVLGGALMGVGGACAQGCSLGQGLSGFSTLSVDALIAIAGMIAGCLWGVRALEAGSAWGGLRLCFQRSSP